MSQRFAKPWNAERALPPPLGRGANAVSLPMSGGRDGLAIEAFLHCLPDRGAAFELVGNAAGVMVAAVCDSAPALSALLGAGATPTAARAPHPLGCLPGVAAAGGPAVTFSELRAPEPGYLPIGAGAGAGQLADLLAGVLVRTAPPALGIVQVRFLRLAPSVEGRWLQQLDQGLIEVAPDGGPAHVEHAPSALKRHAQWLKQKGGGALYALTLRVIAVAPAALLRRTLGALEAALAAVTTPRGRVRLIPRERLVVGRGIRGYLDAVLDRAAVAPGLAVTVEELASLLPVPSAPLVSAYPRAFGVDDPTQPPSHSLASDPDRDSPEVHVMGFAGGRAVGLPAKYRRLSALLVGRSGAGKSTALVTRILGELHAFGPDQALGAIVCDPHAELVEDLLAYLPPKVEGVTRVFSPRSALGCNPLAPVAGLSREDHQGLVIDLFSKFFADDIGHAQAAMLSRSIALVVTTLEAPTMEHLMRLWFDPRFLQGLLASSGDDDLRAFFARELQGRRTPQASLGALAAKIERFTAQPRLRRVFCASGNELGIDGILRDGGLLLADLDKGHWGEDAAALLGQFIVSLVQALSFRKPRVGEAGHVPTLLFYDEFTHMRDPAALDCIFRELRKFGTAAVLGTQYLSGAALPRETVKSLTENYRVLMAMNLSHDEASWVCREFGLKPEAFTTLPEHEAWVRVGIESFRCRTADFRALYRKRRAPFAPAPRAAPDPAAPPPRHDAVAQPRAVDHAPDVARERSFWC